MGLLASMAQAPMSQSRAEMSQVVGSNITQRGLHVKSLSGKIMESLVVQLDVTSTIPGVYLVDPDLDGEKSSAEWTNVTWNQYRPVLVLVSSRDQCLLDQNQGIPRGMKGVGEDNCSATMKSGRKIKTGRFRAFGTLLSSGKTGNTAPEFRAINDWC